jgi:hypothetical protein
MQSGQRIYSARWGVSSLQAEAQDKSNNISCPDLLENCIHIYTHAKVNMLVTQCCVFPDRISLLDIRIVAQERYQGQAAALNHQIPHSQVLNMVKSAEALPFFLAARNKSSSIRC